MAEYIEREAVLAEADYDGNFVLVVPAKKVRNIPAADVVEVKHGRWEKTDDDFYMGLTIFKCSACREEWVFEDMSDIDGLNYHYCPNCGARMDGE